MQYLYNFRRLLIAWLVLCFCGNPAYGKPDEGSTGVEEHKPVTADTGYDSSVNLDKRCLVKFSVGAVIVLILDPGSSYEILTQLKQRLHQFNESPDTVTDPRSPAQILITALVTAIESINPDKNAAIPNAEEALSTITADPNETLSDAVDAYTKLSEQSRVLFNATIARWLRSQGIVFIDSNTISPELWPPDKCDNDEVDSEDTSWTSIIVTVVDDSTAIDTTTQPAIQTTETAVAETAKRKIITTTIMPYGSSLRKWVAMIVLCTYLQPSDGAPVKGWEKFWAACLVQCRKNSKPGPQWLKKCREACRKAFSSMLADQTTSSADVVSTVLVLPVTATTDATEINAEATVAFKSNAVSSIKQSPTSTSTNVALATDTLNDPSGSIPSGSLSTDDAGWGNVAVSTEATKTTSRLVADSTTYYTDKVASNTVSPDNQPLINATPATPEPTNQVVDPTTDASIAAQQTSQDLQQTTSGLVVSSANDNATIMGTSANAQPADEATEAAEASTPATPSYSSHQLIDLLGSNSEAVKSTVLPDNQVLKTTDFRDESVAREADSTATHQIDVPASSTPLSTAPALASEKEADDKTASPENQLTINATPTAHLPTSEEGVGSATDDATTPALPATVNSVAPKVSDESIPSLYSTIDPPEQVDKANTRMLEQIDASTMQTTRFPDAGEVAKISIIEPTTTELLAALPFSEVSSEQWQEVVSTTAMRNGTITEEPSFTDLVTTANTQQFKDEWDCGLEKIRAFCDSLPFNGSFPSASGPLSGCYLNNQGLSCSNGSDVCTASWPSLNDQCLNVTDVSPSPAAPSVNNGGPITMGLAIGCGVGFVGAVGCGLWCLWNKFCSKKRGNNAI